ncbi:MAG: hypothetical protein ACSLE6_12725 [Mycobacterium sp.]
MLPFAGLQNPRGVAVDALGTVHVTDDGNNCVLSSSEIGPETPHGQKPQEPVQTVRAAWLGCAPWLLRSCRSSSC